MEEVTFELSLCMLASFQEQKEWKDHYREAKTSAKVKKKESYNACLGNGMDSEFISLWVQILASSSVVADRGQLLSLCLSFTLFKTGTVIDTFHMVIMKTK